MGNKGCTGEAARCPVSSLCTDSCQPWQSCRQCACGAPTCYMYDEGVFFGLIILPILAAVLLFCWGITAYYRTAYRLHRTAYAGALAVGALAIAFSMVGRGSTRDDGGDWDGFWIFLGMIGASIIFCVTGCCLYSCTCCRMEERDRLMAEEDERIMAAVRAAQNLQLQPQPQAQAQPIDAAAAKAAAAAGAGASGGSGGGGPVVRVVPASLAEPSAPAADVQLAAAPPYANRAPLQFVPFSAAGPPPLPEPHFPAEIEGAPPALTPHAHALSLNIAARNAQPAPEPAIPESETGAAEEMDSVSSPTSRRVPLMPVATPKNRSDASPTPAAAPANGDAAASTPLASSSATAAVSSGGDSSANEPIAITPIVAVVAVVDADGGDVKIDAEASQPAVEPPAVNAVEPTAPTASVAPDSAADNSSFSKDRAIVLS